ncbi:MAG: hypothetical protein IJY05_02735 [Clostridia bacterium]|nr:hypothetical protein [Clostridia bacterium]
MCNLFNTFFGRNTNGYCGYNSYNNGCSCGSQWHCSWQRVCRDCNGNIVVVGNNGSASQNNTTNSGSCNCGCQSCYNAATTTSNTSSASSETYGYARCRSQRTSCGCNY